MKDKRLKVWSWTWSMTKLDIMILSSIFSNAYDIDDDVADNAVLDKNEKFRRKAFQST